MATLAQLRTRVSSKLGLDNTAASDEQSLIDSWANDAVLDILMETQCYVAEATATLTSGSGDYTLDSNILVIKDVFVTSDSQQGMLDHVSPDAILQMRSVGTVPTNPTRYYAINGANTLMIYPNPSSGDTMTFWYVPRPTAMSSASDDPSSSTFGGIPKEWHKAIELYMLWQAADYTDDSASQNGVQYLGQYDAWLRRVKKERNTKTGRNLGAAVPGRRRRPMVPHDNSADFYA